MKKILFPLFLFTSLLCFAQSKKTIKEYTQMTEEIEKSIWGTEDTLFASNKLPEQYKNESAVILAKRQTISSEKKGVYLYFILFSTDSRKAYNNNTIREKIYINDQAALKEYSEFSFKKLMNKSYGSIFSSYAYSFIGIRLIKPDGSIKKVNIDESAVTIKEGNSNAESKIAIPDLEVGDVIDYYIRVSIKESLAYGGSQIDDQIVLASEYPIVKYAYTLEIDKNFGAWYYRFNNAPSFKVTKNEEEKSNVLSLNVQNVEKISTNQWSSPARNIKSIYLVRGYGGCVFGKQRVQKAEVRDFTANQFAMDEHQSNLFVYNAYTIVGSLQNQFLSAYRTLYDEFETYVKKKLDRKVKTMEADETIDLILPLLRKYYFISYYFHYLLENEEGARDAIFKQTPGGFEFAWPYLINRYCEKYNIDSRVIVVENRYAQTFRNIFNDYKECTFLVEITYKGKPHYLSFENGLMTWDVLPAGIDGNAAKHFMYEDSKYAGLIRRGEMNFPKSKSTDNAETNTYKVNLENGNMSLVDVKRTYWGKGQYKIAKQRQLELLQTYAEEVFKELDQPQDLSDFYKEYGKQYKKSVAEFEVFLKKEKDNQKQMFEEEAKEQFDNKPKEFKSFKINKHGLQTKDTTFEMEEELVLDGLALVSC
jgi:hypothetical protein